MLYPLVEVAMVDVSSVLFGLHILCLENLTPERVYYRTLITKEVTLVLDCC